MTCRLGMDCLGSSTTMIKKIGRAGVWGSSDVCSSDLWEYVLEAIDFLRFTPRMWCWRDDVPAWYGLFGQFNHHDKKDRESGRVGEFRRVLFRSLGIRVRSHRFPKVYSSDVVLEG